MKENWKKFLVDEEQKRKNEIENQNEENENTKNIFSIFRIFLCARKE